MQTEKDIKKKSLWDKTMEGPIYFVFDYFI